MKYNIARLKMAFLLCMITGMSLFAGISEEGSKEGALQLYCSEELKDLAGNLAGVYMNENPGVNIRVSELPSGGGQELIDAQTIVLGNKACLGRFNRDENLSLVLGRDVIVPIINAGNPFAEQICEKGLSMEQFSSIYAGSKSPTWGELVGSGGGKQIVVLVPGGSCGRNYLAAYLGGDTPAGEIVESPVEMISRVGDDASAIGFCNLACLEAMEKEGGNNSIVLVPIDVDNNGELSYFENIYGSYENLAHGIYVGKYPTELYTRIYALSSAEAEPEGNAFLEWMLGKGQQQLAQVSILPADYSEKSDGIRALNPMVVTAGMQKTNTPLIILLIVLSLGIIIPIAWLMLKPRKSGLSQKRQAEVDPVAFLAGDADHPAGLLYDHSHTWAIMEQDGQVRVGLDAFIPGITGRLTRIEMKGKGEQLKKGETILSLVQDGKRLEVKSPVSGKISTSNVNILEDPTLLSTAPFEEGWLFRIEPSAWKNETGKFLMVEDYGHWLKKEVSRLKDFFAKALPGAGESQSVILQDGGLLLEGALGACNPETWEMFQEEFL